MASQPSTNRKAQVHEDDVGQARAGAGDGIFTVARFDDVEAGYRQLLRVQLPQLRLIFNDQNQRPGAFDCLCH